MSALPLGGGINWGTAPDFYSPWGSDSAIAAMLRWAVRQPDASEEDLLEILDGLIVPPDVEAVAVARLGGES